MSMPAKWIEGCECNPKVINPAYVEYLESFAKRAAEEIVVHQISDTDTTCCQFCHAEKPDEKSITHAPNCIVLAAQEYLKNE